MNNVDHQYLQHMRRLLDVGAESENRTDTKTLSIFGHQMRFDLRKGFPIVTTKKVFMKGVIHELIWFLSGSTNIKYLVENDVHIWDEWADDNGELGPVYGSQWRDWKSERGASIDQIRELENDLLFKPNSRRMIVTAWNPGVLHKQALPPCHLLFQFGTELIPNAGGMRYLNCHLYQRSADWFLGVPFNISSYALLMMIIARRVGMIPKTFVHSFGDTHLYVNHKIQADIQLGRKGYVLPEMIINPESQIKIDNYKYSDFELINYKHDSGLKGEVAV